MPQVLYPIDLCFNRSCFLALSREFHYWDTYWIIRALLHCEMATTVRGMIENFLGMVRAFGKVPHGNRFYYLNRSQPPMLSLMMKEYWDKTNDLQVTVLN